MDAQQEQQWIEQSRRGDLQAFEGLVRLHQSWLRGWLRGQLSDWSAADDLAQDTFVTAFRQIRQFRGEGSFPAWLRGIAHNHLRNFIRKKRELLMDGETDLEVLLHEVNEEETEHVALDALKDCLDKVEGGAKNLLELRYVHGHTVREISATTGKGYSALTMKLHRLRDSLRECVESQLEGGKA
ncbi:RNA polymerase sigma-70 factor, ECF subfamily [Rubritalea squalenifaciens DSM 18772]|uniref:RNA polymerase sigma factor n=1 Tax=Rubritalea squalenifaciens DSM 18772 TaxID=1123071 RepID=A0A1M6CWB2_9BACT|nr:sigma-70 family RNA polymerase sigma factor [Rubritalea squalenifaciens]SHI65312.1 RNA polymerase sigma-70 factor, ECF subfamily [Rubritalea squalenifaciens DSM 18772]